MQHDSGNSDNNSNNGNAMLKQIGSLLLCACFLVYAGGTAHAESRHAKGPVHAGQAHAHTPSLTSYTQLPMHPPALGTLRFATLEWPPYISSELPGLGYVADVLRETFLPAGYNVELVFLPWKRALSYMSRGDIAGYLPEYYDPAAAETQCTYSDPFPGGPLAFMHRTADPVLFTSVENLRPYRTGVVAGYINFKEFDNAQYLQKDTSPDDLTNLRKLLLNRVDIIIGDPLTVMYLYRTHISEKGSELGIQQPYIENKTLHVCFNKAYSQFETVLPLFNSRLKELERSGRLEELHSTLVQTYLPMTEGTGTGGADRTGRTAGTDGTGGAGGTVGAGGMGGTGGSIMRNATTQ
jgi:polar amino acid transport system substrate-binding protein